MGIELYSYNLSFRSGQIDGFQLRCVFGVCFYYFSLFSFLIIIFSSYCQSLSILDYWEVYFSYLSCPTWIYSRRVYTRPHSLLILQVFSLPDTHDYPLIILPDYYTKTELPLRLAMFWISSYICNIVGSFIAFGVLHLRGAGGKEGWRWLFLVE